MPASSPAPLAEPALPVPDVPVPAVPIVEPAAPVVPGLPVVEPAAPVVPGLPVWLAGVGLLLEQAATANPAVIAHARPADLVKLEPVEKLIPASLPAPMSRRMRNRWRGGFADRRKGHASNAPKTLSLPAGEAAEFQGARNAKTEQRR